MTHLKHREEPEKTQVPEHQLIIPAPSKKRKKVSLSITVYDFVNYLISDI